jgi:hypothetical protein
MWIMLLLVKMPVVLLNVGSKRHGQTHTHTHKHTHTHTHMHVHMPTCACKYEHARFYASCSKLMFFQSASCILVQRRYHQYRIDARLLSDKAAPSQHEVLIAGSQGPDHLAWPSFWWHYWCHYPQPNQAKQKLALPSVRDVGANDASPIALARLPIRIL